MTGQSAAWRGPPEPIGYNAGTRRPVDTRGGSPNWSGRTARAKVAELVDALGLGPSGETRESSSLSFRTSFSVRLLQAGLPASGGSVPRI